jgi:undecaprenyl-diphosphatase
MPELLEAIFLGVVQGLTEFLPVSSSEHQLLAQYFLGVDQERLGLSFDAAIRTGTVLAVVAFFRRDLLRMARAFVRSLPRPHFADPETRLPYLVLVATISAGITGFLFEPFFATTVRYTWVMVFNLVFLGALFLVAEAVGRMNRDLSKLGLLEAMGEALSAVTPEDAQGWFSHCGYEAEAQGS